jgi:predicted peroxiredoxin
MPVRGLTIIVAGLDGDRLRSAVGMAATQAALGGTVRLLLDGVSVRLLASPITAPGDADYAAGGLPTLGELVETALMLGASIILCQSGLALTGMRGDQIDPRFRTGGMTMVLASLGDDRLIAL